MRTAWAASPIRAAARSTRTSSRAVANIVRAEPPSARRRRSQPSGHRANANPPKLGRGIRACPAGRITYSREVPSTASTPSAIAPSTSSCFSTGPDPVASDTMVEPVNTGPISSFSASRPSSRAAAAVSATGIGASRRPASSATSARSSRPPPAPPQSDATPIPSASSSLKRRHRPLSKPDDSAIRTRAGVASFRKSAANVSRTARCSSLSRKSTPRSSSCLSQRAPYSQRGRHMQKGRALFSSYALNVTVERNRHGHTEEGSMAPRLGFPVFDGDNHLYETRDALPKFLPPESRGAIRYVEVDGRTKIATMGQISDYIPNPTFDVVAAPGAQEDYFRHGNPE